MSAFVVFASRDLPVERGWRGWLGRFWASLMGRPSTAYLRASKSFDVEVTPRHGENVRIHGYATDDGDLTIVVEHRGSPRLKWTTKRQQPTK